MSATPQTPQAESITLFFRNDSSDKEYRIHLKERDAGWIVEIQFGKRGSNLRAALKTKDPLEFAAAKKAYDKILAEQLKDAYTPSETGRAYQDTPREKEFTGVGLQLLNPIEEKDFDKCVKGDEWMLEEKFDGERLAMRLKDGVVEGINRSGIRVAVPKHFEQALLASGATSCLIDGEGLGDRYAAFDIMELDGGDLRGLGAKSRKAILDKLVAKLPEESFIRVETAFTEADKQALHDLVKAREGEGVVAKRVDSIYEPGRPNSGGNQLKRKFLESATVQVLGHHKTKRSVSVGTCDASGKVVDRGSVTIPTNHQIPGVGSIVEVIYMNVAGLGGALYQPIYKGPRTDVGLEACGCSQLKFKAEGPATAPKARMRP